ncbi:TonB-dependent receptor [Thermodesulfovibrionales bacterium]|nr:TonB-dependent receptor [Thermodesulfovibrionales bacterium]
MLSVTTKVGATEREESPVIVFDLEEIVITATRHPEPIKGISASVTIIDAEEIAEGGEITILESLRGLPGLDVVQTGGSGATTSIFLRGAASRHTLVLIDGVRVNSPTIGMFDFANLTVDNIERIEIVRGPQSILYGSSAIGGVINIITKRGVGPPRAEISAEGGSLNTHRISLSTSGEVGPFHYSFSVSRFDTAGISRAKVGVEDDRHENTSFSARFGFPVLEEAALDFVLRYTETTADFDGWVMGVGPADDLNYTGDTESFVFSANFNQLITERWSHKASISINDEGLKYKDPDTQGHNSRIDTRISTLNWQHEFAAGEVGTFIAGIEWEEQEGVSKGMPWPPAPAEFVERFDESITNWGYHLQHQLNLKERFFITTGIRVDDHETFGSDTNYQIGVAYLFQEIPVRLRGNWGTGFKAPTLNDLFWYEDWGWGMGMFGNPDLLPEESTGYDLGIDLWGEHFHLGATYFHNNIENLIAWPDVATWRFEARNIDEARTKGVELEISLLPADNFNVTLNYTLTDTEVLAGEHKGNELAHRPQNKYSLSFNYRPIEKLNLNLHLNRVGDRWDDAANTRELDSYTRVDLAGSFDLTRNFQIFARGENILNEEYEEAKGFGTPGASLFAGLRATF